MNAKHQVIVKDASAFPALEESSGRFFIPFVITGGRPATEVGRYRIAYTLTGLRITDHQGQLVYQGYGSEAEHTFFDNERGSDNYLVVLFHQPARKLEKATVGGYISVPKLFEAR